MHKVQTTTKTLLEIQQRILQETMQEIQLKTLLEQTTAAIITKKGTHPFFNCPEDYIRRNLVSKFRSLHAYKSLSYLVQHVPKVPV